MSSLSRTHNHIEIYSSWPSLYLRCTTNASVPKGSRTVTISLDSHNTYVSGDVKIYWGDGAVSVKPWRTNTGTYTHTYEKSNYNYYIYVDAHDINTTKWHRAFDCDVWIRTGYSYHFIYYNPNNPNAPGAVSMSSYSNINTTGTNGLTAIFQRNQQEPPSYPGWHFIGWKAQPQGASSDTRLDTFGTVDMEKRDLNTNSRTMTWPHTVNLQNTGATQSVTPDTTLYAGNSYTEIFSAWVRITTYTVSFDSMGGTPVSSTSRDSTLFNTWVNAPATIPSRAGYQFAGWTDQPGSTVVIAQPGGRIHMVYGTPNRTVYAIWIPLQARFISYVSDGTERHRQDGTSIENSYTFTVMTPKVVGATKPYHKFLRWRTITGATYGPGSQIVLSGTSNLTLYAVWSPFPERIDFDAQEGVPSFYSINKQYGERYNLPSASRKRIGSTIYIMDGWYRPKMPSIHTTAIIKGQSQYTLTNPTDSNEIYVEVYDINGNKMPFSKVVTETDIILTFQSNTTVNMTVVVAG